MTPTLNEKTTKKLRFIQVVQLIAFISITLIIVYDLIIALTHNNGAVNMGLVLQLVFPELILAAIWRFAVWITSQKFQRALTPLLSIDVLVPIILFVVPASSVQSASIIYPYLFVPSFSLQPSFYFLENLNFANISIFSEFLALSLSVLMLVFALLIKHHNNDKQGVTATVVSL